MTKPLASHVWLVLIIFIAVLAQQGCSQQPKMHMVVHVSRALNDSGDAIYRIYYDDGTHDVLKMNVHQTMDFSDERRYHREMNPELWDKAWEETRGKKDSWQAFKDRYVELGGTMLFD